MGETERIEAARAEKAEALIAEMTAVFEIIAGNRPHLIDGLMGNKDIAELMLSRAKEAGYG